MRNVVVIGVVGAVSALALAHTAFQFGAPKIGEERRAVSLEAQEAAGRVGARLMLATTPSHDFGLVVLGRHLGPGLIEFRAQATDDHGRRPAYGRVRALCADDLSDPGCWRLDVLEIDGRSVALIDPNALEPPTADDVATHAASTEVVPPPQHRLAVEAPEAIIRGAASSRDEAPPPQASELRRAPTPAVARVEAPAPAPTDSPQNNPQETSGALIATHQVVGDRVNARAGPGLGYVVLTVLENEAALISVGGPRSADGWSRYRVASGPSSGRDVWISDALVVEIGVDR